MLHHLRRTARVLVIACLLASVSIASGAPANAGTEEEDGALIVILDDGDCGAGLSGYVGASRVSVDKSSFTGSYSGYVGNSRVSVSKSTFTGSLSGYIGNSRVSISKSSFTGSYSGYVGNSRVSVSKSTFTGSLSGYIGNSRVSVDRSSFTGSYSGYVGNSRLSLSCGSSFGGGGASVPSTPTPAPEAAPPPVPAPTAPTTPVDPPASGGGSGLVALGTALPEGALQVGSGNNAYVTYTTDKPDDTCFVNPSAPTQFMQKDLRPIKYTVRRGDTLSWTQISHISGVEYCADGPLFNFSASAFGKNCKNLGSPPNSANPSTSGITAPGGVRATKRGKCGISVRTQRGGATIIHGAIDLRIR